MAPGPSPLLLRPLRQQLRSMVVAGVLDMGPLFVVRPRKGLAFQDAPGKIQSAATRWEFDAR